MLDKDSEDCLMVGNDVHEDMVARNIGIDVFLIEGMWKISLMKIHLILKKEIGIYLKNIFPIFQILIKEITKRKGVTS